MLQRLSEWGAKVTITLQDGSEIDVNSHEELLAVFGEIERERHSASSQYYRGLTDKQIDQHISDLEKRIDQREKFRWALSQEEQGSYHYVIVSPLKKQLQLLLAEQERRTQSTT